MPDAADTADRLMQRVRDLEPQQLQRTRDLIAIPTVNPYSGDASAASEAPGQDWIESQFKALGATTRRVPVPADIYQRVGMVGPVGRKWEGRENVVAEWTLGTGEGPTILLNCHMDTVGTAGMTIDPFDPVIEDGCLLGRGSSDTKGNMVIGLTAVEALLREPAGLNGRLVFESVVDEECDGGGAGTLACCLAGVHGDVAICLDGGGGDICVGCQGIATAQIDVRGRSGHSSTGVGGSVNAINKAIEVKAAVDAFHEDYTRTHPGCMLSVGVFRGGTLPAVVPGHAMFQFNHSYDHSEALAAERKLGRWDGALFRERFEAHLAAFAAKDTWLAEEPPRVTWIKDVYSYRSDADDPAIAVIRGAIGEVRGRPSEPGILPAWCDASHLARHLKVPVVSLGYAVLGAAHAQREYVHVDDLYTGARTVALALHRLLQTR